MPQVEPGRSLLYLSRADVEALAPAPLDLIATVETVFAAKAAGRAQCPPKLGIYPGSGKLFQALVAACDEPAFAATKSLGLEPANPARGLPMIGSLVTLFDGPTGMPLAVMDGAWITAARTAAMSAAAAKRLARKDSTQIGFVACGLQAESHLAHMAALFPLTHVAAHSRRKATAEAFAAKARARGLEAAAVDAPRDAVAGLDIVITSVPEGIGDPPALDAEDVAPGGFVAMVDLGRSWRRDRAARFDVIATDDRTQSEYVGKAGRLVYPGPFHADLGELVAGKHPGRADARQRIAFLFPGFGLGDLAGAMLVYRLACAAGVGTVLPL